MSKSIPFGKAYDIVQENVFLLQQKENIPLTQCIKRILADDIKTDRALPPFNRVAVDGYACRKSDIKNDLEVIEVIPAGYQPKKVVNKNQCAKTMTGGMLPDGADMVFMVEYAEEFGKNKVRFTGTEKQTTKTNFCPKGEDIEKNEIIVEKGTRILPKHIATLASIGSANPKVFVRPKVGIIATGDEIIEPFQKPKEYQIRDANSYQLFCQLQSMGLNAHMYGICEDNKDSLNRTIKKASQDCDVIILSGGISMGDFDLVPNALLSNGYRILFDRVAIKPGKPTTFAVSKKAICFGLPGNPVSVFILFEVLVKSFLLKMMSYDYSPQIIRIPIKINFQRKKTDRDEWIPIEITKDNFAIPVKYHGSGHFQALTRANGILNIARDITEIKKDTVVDVRFI